MDTKQTKQNSVQLKIDWATHEAAKYACQNWHYSNSVPVPPLVKIGAWENEKFIGVVIFSRGASTNLLKPYGLSQIEGCELTRVALSKHVTPVSRILSLAVKFLKKANPGLRLIVSFADPNEGHHGGIYQACNWIYTGRSAPSAKFIDKSGREWHDRLVSKNGFKVKFGKLHKTVKHSECTKIFQLGKHRYLLPLNKDIQKKVESLRIKYPKCASSKVSVATGDQPVEGGAIPTDALHPSEEINEANKNSL